MARTKKTKNIYLDSCGRTPGEGILNALKNKKNEYRRLEDFTMQDMQELLDQIFINYYTQPRRWQTFRKE